MPQIIVTAETAPDASRRPVMFTERVSVSDFESQHFQSQLVERINWAVGDADAVERHGRLQCEVGAEPADDYDVVEPERVDDEDVVAPPTTPISAAQPVS